MPSPISHPADDNRVPQRERAHDSKRMPSSYRLQPTRPVLANYASLALLDIATGALMSLPWSTPIVAQRTRPDSGAGVRLRERHLIVRVFSMPRHTFLARGEATFCHGLRPLRMSWLAAARATAVVWPLIALQLLLHSVSDMGFGIFSPYFLAATFFTSIVRPGRGFMFISSASPNKRLRLARRYEWPRANGRLDPARGRLGACGFVRTFSLQNNVLGGYFAYVVLLFFVGVALCVAIQLPRDTWGHASGE
ncbi:hypothetical protein EDB86DRAFT_2246026 [Lactarius hatsudake]|nr:hypothetical protein EDB86DRAFT_2246026 [Lactarius hatsudake]